MDLSELRPELAAAYRQCRRVHAHYGRTFYLATQLLPQERRPHVWALYAFARTADELVDATGGPDPVALEAFSARALAVLRSEDPPDPVAEPVLAATWNTMVTYDLAPTLVEEFLASMAMDLTVSRYPTWTDLRVYMRGSAAVIGEQMAPILGADGPQGAFHAGLLGEAFQLTNFIRDVAEDHDRGRVYLPLEDLARHGVSEQMLAQAVSTGCPSRELRELVRFETQRALDVYAAARPGLSMVDGSSRACVEAAFTLYRMILQQVVTADYDVFSRRHTVPTSRRLATAARIVLPGVAGRLVPWR